MYVKLDTGAAGLFTCEGCADGCPGALLATGRYIIPPECAGMTLFCCGIALGAEEAAVPAKAF